MEKTTGITETLATILDVLSKAPGQEVAPEEPALGELWEDQNGLVRYFNGTEWLELES